MPKIETGPKAEDVHPSKAAPQSDRDKAQGREMKRLGSAGRKGADRRKALDDKAEPKGSPANPSDIDSLPKDDARFTGAGGDPVASALTGPAAGGDPSVPLAVEALGDTPLNAAAQMQLDQDNGAGPRQEPVHQGAVQHEGEEAPRKHKKLGDADHDTVVRGVLHAMEKSELVSHTDEHGRTWAAHYEPVSNQATVKLTVQRGHDIHSTNLSTATLNDEVASNAVKALHGKVK